MTPANSSKKKAVSKTTKKAAVKAPAKAPAKKAAVKAPAKSFGKSSAKKAAVKAPAKKVAVKKVVAKKAAPAPAKKSAPAAATRSPNIVKPSLAKKSSQGSTKLQSTTKGDSTTISVAPKENPDGPAVVVEEKRLMMIPPPRPQHGAKGVKSEKSSASAKGVKKVLLKPIKAAPAPAAVDSSEGAWTASEFKAMRSELLKDLTRLKAELADAEGEMEDLILAAGVGAGDDQADAGTKTFEREHEMSLVYNARDMVLQTERAIERIDTKTYGRCEECGNPIGKARLQVFPRATLCMVCKQKEERR